MHRDTLLKMASLKNSKKNGVTSPMLTDLYQITMVYGYWKSGKASDPATFDLYFRKNPFHGEFTIFAGLHECLRYIEKFEILDEGKHQCISLDVTGFNTSDVKWFISWKFNLDWES